MPTPPPELLKPVPNACQGGLCFVDPKTPGITAAQRPQELKVMQSYIGTYIRREQACRAFVGTYMEVKNSEGGDE